MKKELIDYHFREFSMLSGTAEQAANGNPPLMLDAQYLRHKAQFHKDAVEWLEGLIEDEQAMKIAGSIPFEKSKT